MEKRKSNPHEASLQGSGEQEEGKQRTRAVSHWMHLHTPFYGPCKKLFFIINNFVHSQIPYVSTD